MGLHTKHNGSIDSRVTEPSLGRMPFNLLGKHSNAGPRPGRRQGVVYSHQCRKKERPRLSCILKCSNRRQGCHLSAPATFNRPFVWTLLFRSLDAWLDKSFALATGGFPPPPLFPLSFLFAEGIDQQLNFPQFFSICPHLLRRTAGCGNIPVSASFRAEQRSQLTVKCGIVTVVMGDMGTCIFTSVLHALFPPFAV